MLAIAALGTPHVSRVSPRLVPSWAMMLASGNPLLTLSPYGQARSARTSGKIPTLLSIAANIVLAFVVGNPNLPAPVERRV